MIATSIIISQASSRKFQDYTNKNTELKIPEGYHISQIDVRVSEFFINNGPWHIRVYVANNELDVTSDTPNPSFFQSFVIPDQPTDFSFEDAVSVGVNARNTHQFIVNMTALCSLTLQKWETWQIDTYNSIISAYQALKSNYDDAVATNLGILAAVISLTPLIRYLKNSPD